MLNLFLLRRCIEELNPDPAFPGCVYSEMKMCLAPCFKGCSDERYQQESAEVFAFLSTRGGSMLSKLEGERNAASEAMEFERAAAIHQRMQKVQSVAHLASEAVRPLAQLTGILVQPSAEPGHVALFALRRGVWSGPALYSIVGMRLANERSGSSSLFAHPVALEPVPLEGAGALPRKICWSRGWRRLCRRWLSRRRSLFPRKPYRTTWRCSRNGFTGLRRGPRGRWSLLERMGRCRASRCCAPSPGWPRELIARTRKSWPSRRSSGTPRWQRSESEFHGRLNLDS